MKRRKRKKLDCQVERSRVTVGRFSPQLPLMKREEKSTVVSSLLLVKSVRG